MNNPAYILGSGITLSDLRNYDFGNAPVIALNAACMFRKPTIFFSIDGNHLTDSKFMSGFHYKYFTEILPQPDVIKMLEVMDAYQYRLYLMGKRKGTYRKYKGHDSYGKYIFERIPDIPRPNLKFFIGERNRQFGKTPFILKGGSVAFGALHYAYRSGYNPIIFAGIDCCMFDKDHAWQKYYWENEGYDWMNAKMIKELKSYDGGNCKTMEAPNGEVVMTSNSLRTFKGVLYNTVAQINKAGVAVYKLNPRGMLGLPVIKSHDEALNKPFQSANFKITPVKYSIIPYEHLRSCYTTIDKLVGNYFGEAELDQIDKGYLNHK